MRNLTIAILLLSSLAHAEECAQEREAIKKYTHGAPGIRTMDEYRQLSHAIYLCDQAKGRALEAAQRAAIEARKQAEAEQARADAERLEEMKADPKAQRLAWSALWCAAETDRREAMEAIKGYHEAAKLGGVLDLYHVNVWQETAMRAKKRQAEAKAKGKLMACSAPEVARVALCLGDDYSDECQASDKVYGQLISQ
jgi:hypothetical protein